MTARRFARIGMFFVFLLPCIVLAQPAPSPEPPGPATRYLATPEEIALLETDLMARVKENQERHCLRPVLRGKPLPGSAEADIVAVVEGNELSACYEAAMAQADALRTWFDLGSHESGPPIAMVETCIGLPAAVTRASRHEDACSPYLFGRRAVPKLLTALRAGKAVTMQVRVLGDAGKTEEALSLGLDALRFFQDLERGPGAPLIAAMIATAANEMLVQDGLRRVLSGPAPTEAVLERTAKEVDVLLASEPGFCDFLPYERYGMALQLFLPVLKGSDWTPPGGFDGLGPAPVRVPGGATFGTYKWNEAALSWLGMDRVHGLLAQACEGSPSALALKGVLDGLGDELARRATESNWRRIFAVLLAKDPVLSIREWIFDILGGIAVPALGKYVLRYQERKFLLQSLRIHLEVLAEHGRSGKCPPVGPLADVRFEGVFATPDAVDPMQVDVAADGTVTLRPSAAFLAARGEGHRIPEYVFACR